MKKKLCFGVFLLGMHFLQAQSYENVEKNMFKVNILNPGIVFEKGISSKITLNSEVKLALSYRSNFELGKGFYFFPRIEEQIRYYYNLEKRSLDDKNTSNNSGNYIAVLGLYNFKSLTTNSNLGYFDKSLVFGALWGTLGHAKNL